MLPTTPDQTILAFIKERLAAGEQVLVSATEPFMSPNEVAELVGVSRPYIVKKIEQGEIAASKKGNRHRISVAEAQRFRAWYLDESATVLGEDF